MLLYFLAMRTDDSLLKVAVLLTSTVVRARKLKGPSCGADADAGGDGSFGGSRDTVGLTRTWTSCSASSYASVSAFPKFIPLPLRFGSVLVLHPK